jgi:tellurite methyltransferase
MTDLRERCGGIDIYLFDQLLRGRLAPGARVLDAGCGRGRNLVYLLGHDFEVWGVDRDPAAVAATRALAERILGAGVDLNRFQRAKLTSLPFEAEEFDFVLSSAVLHFSEDEEAFRAAVEEMWRVLASGGVFFARLASTIGIEALVEPTEGRWHRLPDGTDRFLVDEPLLMGLTDTLGGELLDPLKTTVVQGMRSMTTWVVRKP